MTAFARTELDSPQGSLVWELRSVNHRYLDIAMRLPDELRDREMVFRGHLQKGLNRGRIDAQLRWQPPGENADGARLDGVAVEKLEKLASQVVRLAPDTEPLRMVDILRWPGVIVVPDIDFDELAGSASAALDKAVDELVAMRRTEGERTSQVIVEKLDQIEVIVKALGGVLPEIEAAVRQRLETRLQEISDQFDPGRIEQEVVMLLQRADVGEELDRLAIHTREVRDLLDSDKPVGRRLDFLMQELNRESNTLGSKSTHETLTRSAVDLKVLVEQIREQVQNIE